MRGLKIQTNQQHESLVKHIMGLARTLQEPFHARRQGQEQGQAGDKPASQATLVTVDGNYADQRS
jgi:hypothetical protein